MPLYIRDDEVAKLARELQKATRAPTLTEAVRTALQHEMERARGATPLAQRIRRYQEQVAAAGPDDPAFDMKRFTDEMWGEA